MFGPQPAWRHMDDPLRTRMITYRSSDVVEGQPGLPLPSLGSHCAYVREEGNATGETERAEGRGGNTEMEQGQCGDIENRAR